MLNAAIAFLAMLLIAGYALHRRATRGHRRISQGQKTLRGLHDVMTAYRSGDYQAALEYTGELKRGWSETAESCFFRGKALYQLGRLPESEDALRKGAALETDSRRKALSAEALGYTLMEQNRFAEAIASFEQCVRFRPERGSGERAIAEALLRDAERLPAPSAPDADAQARKISEALDHARRGADLDRRNPGLNEEIHRTNLCEALATLAWALAANESEAGTKTTDQIDPVLAETFQLAEGVSQYTAAQIYYHAGRAYGCLGIAEKAAEYYERSSRSDQQGNYGRLARAALAKNASR